MELKVRKLIERVETLYLENGQSLAHPHRVAIAAVVFENPYGQGYVHDLIGIADAIAPKIGDLIGQRTVDLLGEPVEAYGKAAVVGIEGEVEHGSALIHNLLFGNRFRDPAGGTELLPAAEKVGLTGAAVDIPIKHKLDSKTRSHHQTVTFRVEDAPLPREILVACVASNGGRPLARLATFGAEVKS